MHERDSISPTTRRERVPRTLYLVEKAIAKCKGPTNLKGDRPLVSVYLDSLNEVKPKDIEAAIVPALGKRKLKLVETPVILPSSNSTAGLVAADVLAYLTSWDVLSPKPSEAEQASLFETEVEKLNAVKLATIRKTLELIKEVQVIKA